MANKRYEISGEQWEQIKDMFPKAKTGRPTKDNRVIFNTILWFARSGAAWADIPARYGMILIKLFTVVFVNCVTTVPFCAFSKL